MVNSKLPTHRRINKGDLGPEAPSWVDKLLYPLNAFMQATVALLQGRLELEENVKARFMDIQVNGTNSSFSFINPLDRSLRGLILVQASGLTSGNAIGVSQWIEVGGQIIGTIEGLTAGTDYTLSLLVF